jgi:hypothetical protein
LREIDARRGAREKLRNRPARWQRRRSANLLQGEAVDASTNEGATMSTKNTTHGNGHTAHTAVAAEPAPSPKAATKYVPQPLPASIAASSAPTTEQVTAWVQQLDEMAAQFGPGATPLTIDERRRLLKIRPGGEAHATTVMGLADRYGLAIPGVTSADVAANVKVAQDFAPFIERLQSMLGLASDVSLTAQSRVWSSATKAYATLTRLVPDYPSLQKELTPMASFLATKYKDAPTSLRTQEQKTNAKSRSTRSANQKAASAAAAAGAETSPTAKTTTAPTAPTAPTATEAQQAMKI